MKTLLLMRHAKSNMAEKASQDRERSLSKRGRKNAAQMGELLKDEKMMPDFILASNASRTSQTADQLIEALKYKGDRCFLNRLYMAEVDVMKTELRRDLNLLAAVGVGLGAIIGAGIFVVTGVAAGWPARRFWLVCCWPGSVATFNALSSAQLAAAYPQSGDVRVRLSGAASLAGLCRRLDVPGQQAGGRRNGGAGLRRLPERAHPRHPERPARLPRCFC
jgi:hypothetical protein